MKHWCSAAGSIVAVGILAVACAAVAAEEIPPIGVAALTAFEKLPLLADWPCYQASSYSRENVNADAGNFIRVEPNSEQVMLEAEGPGCIYRVWTTGVVEPNVPIQSSDEARILMYFDGEEKPRINLSVPEMFGLRGTYPFVPPLSRSFESGRGAWEGHASICYVPIPFEKSIKVTGNKMSFYHIDYYLFPKGTPLKSFTMDVAPADRRILEKAAKILNAAGEDPKPRASNAQQHGNPGSLEPGQAREIVVDGPAVIDALWVKVEPPTHLALRGLELQIVYDGARGPSVRSPLGDFFGTGCDDRRFKSLPLGMTDEGYYCYFPMPFRQRAVVRIENQTDRSFTLARFEVIAHQVDGLPDNAGYFHALYGQQKDIPHGQDYHIVRAEGRGKFCGCNLTMQSAARAGGIFFLEGDEKIYVDGETWPSRYLGTGTEDYFNGAYFWNAVDFEHGPYSGLTYKDWGTKRVCAYRFHITDAVNFGKSIVVDIEHGPVSDHPSDYAGVAYWYQLPAAALPTLPSLADRMPVTYVSDGPFIRAAVKIVSGPKAGDADLPTRPWQEADPEFFGTKPQRYWKAPSPGETITIGVESPAEEIFNLTVYLSASADGARVEVGLDGKTLGTINTYAGQFVPWFPTTWSDLRLTRGQHLLTIKTLERDSRSSGNTVGWVGADFVPTSPFLSDWYVIGPFDNANHSGFDKVFPPEQGIDFAATYDGLGEQKVGWKPVHVEQIVNLASVCGGGDWRLAYGLTHIWAPERMETAAIFCKDDGAKIWVNGSVVFNENSWSHCFPDTYTAPLTLEKGWNTLLIKDANHGGAWAFGVRLCDPDRRLKVSRDKQ
jgi:hypothetical protein